MAPLNMKTKFVCKWRKNTNIRMKYVALTFCTTKANETHLGNQANDQTFLTTLTASQLASFVHRQLYGTTLRIEQSRKLSRFHRESQGKITDVLNIKVTDVNLVARVSHLPAP